MINSLDFRTGENSERGLPLAISVLQKEREPGPLQCTVVGKAGSLRKAMVSVLGILATLVVLSCGGCQGKGTLPKQSFAQMPGALAAGDVVKLSFPGAPELNQTQKVRADGKISLPLIGEVVVSGKRLGEFQTELSRLYKSQLKNTEVVVGLESSVIPVYVTGAVNNPGKVVLDRPMTVLEAIMEAGGPSNLGDMKKVVVIRNSNSRHYTQTFDLSAPLKGQPTGVFYLKAYDMINVAERFF